jgi:hypothetical protein
MKITAEDVFTSFYNAFHKLELLEPGEEPEQVTAAQKEIEKELKECSQLLEKYVVMRTRAVIKKMIYDGELMEKTK